MLSVSGSLTVKCALAVPLDETIPITCSPVDNFFIKSGLSVTIILPALPYNPCLSQALCHQVLLLQNLKMLH